MKKIYEVRINTIDAYYGMTNGYRTAGYTLDADKAHELRNRTIAKLWERDWWMDTAKNGQGDPDVVVVELGEVWE